MDLIEELKREEGFSEVVYKDHLGFDTIGYGTKMPLSEAECELLLRSRLSVFIAEVDNKLGYLDIRQEAKDILYLMAYQMGLAGVMKFKMMIKALEIQDYYKASSEMLNSRWAKQTPNRANALAVKMRNA
jgi:lysozyme